MEEKNIIRRTSEDLRKVIKEQSNGFKILHKKLDEKTKKIYELETENSVLKYNIKCLEKEVFRLKYDKRKNA